MSFSFDSKVQGHGLALALILTRVANHERLTGHGGHGVELTCHDGGGGSGGMTREADDTKLERHGNSAS